MLTSTMQAPSVYQKSNKKFWIMFLNSSLVHKDYISLFKKFIVETGYSSKPNVVIF